MSEGARSFAVHTLGCPKNQVDSDKLVGMLAADGLVRTEDTSEADLVVVNTCAFVEEARQESVDTILALADAKSPDASLVVTGCLAERYGDELAESMPEIDRVAGFGMTLLPGGGTHVPGSASVGDRLVEPGYAAAGDRLVEPGSAAAGDRLVETGNAAVAAPVPVELRRSRLPASGSGPVEQSGSRLPASGSGPVEQSGSRASGSGPVEQSGSGLPAFDLLNLPRPRSPRPWAYVKIAEGCDRACGFCAIPSFRGPQRSRSMQQILAEVDQLDAAEIVLVAQDLASYGRDQGTGERRIVPLVEAVSARTARTRLLYLYPSDLTDALIDAVCATGVPYFDLSLQHVSAPLLRRMRRWGNGDKFLARIEAIRRREPDAAFRSNFIVGYPGETEDDHDRLLRFVEEAQLDWCGFFAYSEEAGTYSSTLGGAVDEGLRSDRLAELGELQDAITAHRRDLLVGSRVEVLVDEPGVGRTHREAPEIDGIVIVPRGLVPGTFAPVTVTAAMGCDLEAV